MGDDSDGLGPNQVRLVPADPDGWRARFVREAGRLQARIGSQLLNVEHVGSTAIPGIRAKPILDIAIAVREEPVPTELVGEIEALGYEHHGDRGVPGRCFFTWGSPVRVHLHLFGERNVHWRNMLLFRDRLRANVEEARHYESLKSELARRFPEEREAYQQGKQEFILGVLVRARAAAEAGDGASS